MERREITGTCGYYTTFMGKTRFIAETMDWDGATLDEVINKIELIRSKYGSIFKDIRIEKDIDCDYYGNREIIWRFVGKRMETDEEYNARVESVNKTEADRIARDRAEYERLKAQFEN